MDTGRGALDGTQRDGPEGPLPAARATLAQQRAAVGDGGQQRPRARLDPDRRIAAWIERLVDLHAAHHRSAVGRRRARVSVWVSSTPIARPRALPARPSCSRSWRRPRASPGSSPWSRLTWAGRLAIVSELLSPAAPHVADGMLVASSLGLVLLGRGLARRRHRSWQAALWLLAISCVGHLLKERDVIDSIVSAVPFALLWWKRGRLRRRRRSRTARRARSRPASGRSPGSTPTASPRPTSTPRCAACRSSFGDTLDERHARARRRRSEQRSGPLRARADDQPRERRDHLRRLRRLARAAAARLRRQPRPRPTAATRAGSSSATGATRSPTSRCAATSRTSSTRSARRSSPTAPSAASRSSPAIPSATPTAAPALLADFARHCHAHAWRVAALGVARAHLADWHAIGLRTIYIGDEAVVHPARFSLEGRPIRKVRQSVTRLRKAGHTARVVRARELTIEQRREIERVSRSWLRGQPERGFSMALDDMHAPDHGDAVFALGYDARAPARRLRALRAGARQRRPLALGHAPPAPHAQRAHGVPALRDVPVGRAAAASSASRSTSTPSATSCAATRSCPPGSAACASCWHAPTASSRSSACSTSTASSSREWEPRYAAFERYSDLPLAALVLLSIESLVAWPGVLRRLWPHASPVPTAPAADRPRRGRGRAPSDGPRTLWVDG